MPRKHPTDRTRLYNEVQSKYGEATAAELMHLMEWSDRPHDDIGRVLKCHLMLEHTMTGLLVHLFKTTALDDVRLSFFQKAKLLPADFDDPPLRQAILRINEIRNKLAHDGSFKLAGTDLAVLRAARTDGPRVPARAAPADVIESFAHYACGILIGFKLASRMDPS